jgi:hypothetical protein
MGRVLFGLLIELEKTRERQITPLKVAAIAKGSMG